MPDETSKQTAQQVTALTRLLVDTVTSGSANKIAKQLQPQFVDRSTEYLYRKAMPKDNDASKELFKYIKDSIMTASIPTRRSMKLSFPPKCYSSNDPITLLYQSNYKLIQYWVCAILDNEDFAAQLIAGMEQTGVDCSNINEFLHKEFDILAHMQQMPAIAGVEKEQPDYGDFNKNKPNNYKYLDAQKKIEHIYCGELAEKESLERGGPKDKIGEYTPLELESPDQFHDIATEITLEQCMKILTPKEQIILQMRLDDKKLKDIAAATGYHDASGVRKALKRIEKKVVEAGLIIPE